MVDVTEAELLTELLQAAQKFLTENQINACIPAETETKAENNPAESDDEYESAHSEDEAAGSQGSERGKKELSDNDIVKMVDELVGNFMQFETTPVDQRYLDDLTRRKKEIKPKISLKNSIEYAIVVNLYNLLRDIKVQKEK